MAEATLHEHQSRLLGVLTIKAAQRFGAETFLIEEDNRFFCLGKQTGCGELSRTTQADDGWHRVPSYSSRTLDRNMPTAR